MEIMGSRQIRKTTVLGSFILLMENFQPKKIYYLFLD
jgi:hypothetical protein